MRLLLGVGLLAGAGDRPARSGLVGVKPSLVPKAGLLHGAGEDAGERGKPGEEVAEHLAAEELFGGELSLGGCRSYQLTAFEIEEGEIREFGVVLDSLDSVGNVAEECLGDLAGGARQKGRLLLNRVDECVELLEVV